MHLISITIIFWLHTVCQIFASGRQHVKKCKDGMCQVSHTSVIQS